MAHGHRESQGGGPSDWPGSVDGGHASEFMAGRREIAPAPSNLVRYEQLARLHVLPALGAIPLGRLEPIDVKVMQQRMLEAGAARVPPARRVRSCMGP